MNRLPNLSRGSVRVVGRKAALTARESDPPWLLLTPEQSNRARTWGLTNRRGKPLTSQAIGARIYLETLNCPACFGGLLTIHAGGEEICLMGDRSDSFGDKDIYRATRR